MMEIKQDTKRDTQRLQPFSFGKCCPIKYSAESSLIRLQFFITKKKKKTKGIILQKIIELGSEIQNIIVKSSTDHKK